MLYNIKDYNPELFYQPEVEPMKLWKLPRGCFFRIAGEEPVYYFDKVFGTIVAKEFVSVQPMNMPSGLVFFLDFQYGNTKNPFTAGQSLYGDRNASGQFPFSTTGVNGGLYNPSNKYTYSTNQFSASTALSSSATQAGPSAYAAGTGSVVSASWAEVNFDSAFSASFAAGQIYKITIPTASTALTSFDPDAVRGFIPVSGAIFTSASLLPQFTTYNYTGNSISFFYTGAANFVGIGINSVLISSQFVVES